MQPSRMKRILVVALLFATSSYFHIRLFQRAPQLQPQRSTATEAVVPRLQYIRPPGQKEELLAIFEEITDETSSSYQRQQLPKTPREIARKYGIPETARDVQCSENRTTLGWIPNAFTHPEDGFTHSGRIPRLIFQSWKTNQLRHEACQLALEWSRMNPEYDYFLFDDAAVDRFIRLEYGTEIFAAYACVSVGAAKCDVWRLLAVYLFGGIYFDADVRLKTPFAEWGWGERSVVTARSCTAARRKYPGGCAHQWGLIYAARHPVLYAAIRETLGNLAERQATHVYDISFWSFYHAWSRGPYNQSYMPGWVEEMGGRVKFQDDAVKAGMKEETEYWQAAKRMWHDECL